MFTLSIVRARPRLASHSSRMAQHPPGRGRGQARGRQEQALRPLSRVCVIFLFSFSSDQPDVDDSLHIGTRLSSLLVTVILLATHTLMYIW